MTFSSGNARTRNSTGQRLKNRRRNGPVTVPVTIRRLLSTSAGSEKAVLNFITTPISPTPSGYALTTASFSITPLRIPHDLSAQRELGT
ncbi:uncharacterized protein TRUGW13939_08498 [Talaromyces rugulosus]|uniref:Uncharacterized protein n=1 Tax=Talaromyces rugulosus TaxID=121627 RepID=A0A7H8R4S3_TALRU|nr:uncharacterized protein TRUGW13939_08498 [Talaromyces rugulosus]QKX61350.1 hypothetical protein TRUGW13939_08498 [Talaromyces rugulosus]